MTVSDDKQGASADAVSTGIGVVHVMPAGYQGGKLPVGSKAQAPKAPAPASDSARRGLPTGQAGAGTPPIMPKPSEVKAPPKAPAPPVKNPHKKRVLFFVAGGVLVVLLTALAVVFFVVPAPEAPSEPPAPVVSVPVPAEVPGRGAGTPPIIPEPEPPAEPFVREPTPGRDSDSDGLTDVEERMYGSNVRLPDTDRDGFLDGNEVFHQYDPTRPDPATLLERKVVKEFNAGGLRYVLPTLWQVQSAFEPQVNASVSLGGGQIDLPSGEKINFGWEPIVEGSTLRDELERMSKEQNDPSLLDAEYSTSKTRHELAMQKDQMRAVLLVNGGLVTFQYTLGEKTSIDFIQTFQMMVNSVDVASVHQGNL